MDCGTGTAAAAQYTIMSPGCVLFLGPACISVPLKQTLTLTVSPSQIAGAISFPLQVSNTSPIALAEATEILKKNGKRKTTTISTVRRILLVTLYPP
jgi:hypothetical protein